MGSDPRRVFDQKDESGFRLKLFGEQNDLMVVNAGSPDRMKMHNKV